MAGSIKEISQIVGVSPSAVSVVLNNKGDEFRISKETQKKIFEAAKNLNYTPKKVGVNLGNTNRKPIIVLLVANRVSAPNYSSFFLGLRSAQAETGNTIDVMMQPYIPGKLNECQILKGGIADGFVITGITDDDYDFIKNNRPKVPTVLYNHKTDVFPSVIADDISADYRLAEYFSSRNRKNVMLITPLTGSLGFSQHILGFTDACYKFNFESFVVDFEEYSYEGGKTAAKKIMDSKVDAVFFTSSIMANGALSELKKNNFDFSTNFDFATIGSGLGVKLRPDPIITLDIPGQDMISAAVKIIVSKLNHEETDTSLVFELELNTEK